MPLEYDIPDFVIDTRQPPEQIDYEIEHRNVENLHQWRLKKLALKRRLARLNPPPQRSA